MARFICIVKASLLWLCVVVTCGCAAPPIGVVDTQAPAPSTSESVLVQGVKPSNYRVAFVKGKISGGKFEQTKAVGVLVGSPSQGYLVGKVQAGDVIAITLFNRPRDERRLRVNFDLCGKDVLVFTVPEGKVAYLGDISIEETGENSFNVNFSSDVKAATEHIDTYYPALKGGLELIPAQIMPYACAPGYEWHLIYRKR